MNSGTSSPRVHEAVHPQCGRGRASRVAAALLGLPNGRSESRNDEADVRTHGRCVAGGLDSSSSGGRQDGGHPRRPATEANVGWRSRERRRRSSRAVTRREHRWSRPLLCSSRFGRPCLVNAFRRYGEPGRRSTVVDYSGATTNRDGFGRGPHASGDARGGADPVRRDRSRANHDSHRRRRSRHRPGDGDAVLR